MDVFFLRTNQANAYSWLFTDDPGGRLFQVEIARFSELGTSSMVDRPPLSATLACITVYALSSSKKDIHAPKNQQLYIHNILIN